MRGGAAVLAAVALVAWAGCAGDDGAGEPGGGEPGGGEPRAAEPSATHPARAPAERRRSRPRLEQAACPPDLANCRTASGRILYVERVDPDGDRDAHFVLHSCEAITGPGISVIDVKRSLRPSPLPGPGDRLSAAGPVYRGSYGQRQIEAVELHVARSD